MVEVAVSIAAVVVVQVRFAELEETNQTRYNQGQESEKLLK